VSEPAFLGFEQILILHERSLRAYGGTSGIRDEGLVRSAVHQPRNDYFYGGADLFGIAAGYAFHLAQAQAFLDGNKRTAIAAAITFLEGNGVPTKTSTEPLYDAMIAIAEKRMTKIELAQLFRDLFAR
jgi:death-on-curing protein